jgi:CBS domain containing-hemolysin-like protein
MAPKNIALAAPEATLRWLVLPYQAYLALVRPFVVLLNGMANLGCRLVGVEPRNELVAVHSATELAAIVNHASEGGSIEADSAELLSGALDFARRTVDEVAVPIEELATLRLGATVAQAERVVASSGQERIPIVGPDQQLRLIGYVHARDLATVDASRRQLPLPPDLVRRMAVVRADRPLTETLRVLRAVGRQMALVVAGGEPVGVISVEDIIRALIEPTGQQAEPVRL